MSINEYISSEYSYGDVISSENQELIDNDDTYPRFRNSDLVRMEYTDLCIDLLFMLQDSGSELCTIFFNEATAYDIAKFLRRYNSKFHCVLV